MKEVEIQYFTEKEEEFIHALEELGMTRKVATVLVFLSNRKTTTSRNIERETDLRQSEVSIAMKYLMGRGWVTARYEPNPYKGRSIRSFARSVPMAEIIGTIEKEKREEATEKLAAIQKAREFGRVRQ